MLRSAAGYRSALLLVLTLVGITFASFARGSCAYAQTAVPTSPLAGVQSNGQSAAQPVAGENATGTPLQHLAMPFGVGERMDYDVRFWNGDRGDASMEVKEVVDVRGKPAWHTVFAVKARMLGFFSVNIKLESWFDVITMNSLRFFQDQQYTGSKGKIQHIEIFPERGMYKEDALEERVATANPLDDGSFLYFVRSVPLEVGKEYTWSRYYKPDKNPVKIVVVRRETITTKAGTFNTLVLRPEIKSGGLFAEGKAEAWVTDDSARMVVKLESDVGPGTLSLQLKSFHLGAPVKP
ncbi:MAG: DUF3108 domain-containing protein [Gemmatimonas sp.]